MVSYVVTRCLLPCGVPGSKSTSDVYDLVWQMPGEFMVRINSTASCWKLSIGGPELLKISLPEGNIFVVAQSPDEKSYDVFFSDVKYLYDSSGRKTQLATADELRVRDFLHSALCRDGWVFRDASPTVSPTRVRRSSPLSRAARSVAVWLAKVWRTAMRGERGRN